MNNPKFQIFKSAVNAHYYYHLKAANGEIILSGEGYKTIQSCREGISSVRTNAILDIRYDRKDVTNNYSFNLKAANGEIIGRSESYTSFAAREAGISAVKKDAPGAPTEDLS